MKILHTVEFYSPSVGGAQEVVKQLSERMVALGHEVTVATTKLSERKQKIINGVRIKEFEISGNAVKGYKGDIDSYKQFLLNSNFDVVMNYAAQQWTADLFFKVMDKIYAKKIFVPCGFSGLYSPLYKDYFKLMPSILKKYDATVYLSNSYRDIDFARQHGMNNIHVITNGADEQEFLNTSLIDMRKILGIPANHLIVLTVGSHTGNKGHNETIKIFKKGNFKHATLVIVGNEINNGCYRKCSLGRLSSRFDISLGFADKSIKVVNLSREQTVAAYQQADIFLFPSNIECSPLVLFEAAASKTPFLTTNVGNALEICEWTKGGRLLPTINLSGGRVVAEINSSAAMLTSLIKDPKLREKMGNDGFRLWKKDFTWEEITLDYLRLYESL